MSANYWNSSQRNQWQFTRDELTIARNSLNTTTTTTTTYDSTIKLDINLRIYLHQLIIKLGRKLNLRQIILSTSEIYLQRFLLKVNINEINLYLLITTCIYISCKIEENPQHIRTLLSESRNCWPEFIPNDLTKLAEFEFYLIEELNCYLIIHHPYNSLIELTKIFKNDLTIDEIQSCWSIINDSYITDLHLLFPPHIIAISSIYLTLILSNDEFKLSGGDISKFSNSKIENLVRFLSISNVDLSEVIESVQELLTLYESWCYYDEIYIRNGVHNMLLNK
ncbi:hypothetical protein CANARDRAFT_6442 [[Candida] arabinofermentans NRRL YB-2248]|uniref:Cyclin-like domain-containing protein n=1 Tax=[Candida] arabinofermentans NRRL YB-2248 TaxID=983967 RepID=A0A1E4T570_9ASCO|nr:hypothetical protein CANARDRAFT_6442 [[Candida] arabinofermentans NRRL YB-2248]